MLSASSTSFSSPPTAVLPKKLVGGICCGSPTTTTCLPRAITPIASQTSICEASSNTMRSNGSISMSRNCATESGLIRKHGLYLATRSPLSARSLRTGVRPLFLFSSRLRAPSWRFSSLVKCPPSKSGYREAIFAKMACWDRWEYLSISLWNSAIFDSWLRPKKPGRIGQASST